MNCQFGHAPTPMCPFIRTSTAATFAALVLLGSATRLSAASDAYRGLWVGQIQVNYVNEVPVPLDRNNVPIAPDPKVPTPTADQAQLRVILHVNGAGQVVLLRDVAVVNRRVPSVAAALPTAVAGGAVESDLVLLTDPGLYGAFPPQAALRVGSVAFDFGDARATAALEEVVRRAAEAAAASVEASSEDFGTAGGRSAATAAARGAAVTAATPVLAEADLAKTFGEFLRDDFKPADVDAIAAAADPELEAQDERAEAVAVRDGSFLRDSRAVEMVDAVVGAVLAGSGAGAKRTAAQNMAAAHADVGDNYHRFLAGKIFGDMILGGAASGATAAVANGATQDSIRLAVNGNAGVVAARREALQIRVTPYVDTRATDAVELVLGAMLDAVFGALPAVQGQLGTIEALAASTGRAALAESVVRYPITRLGPSSAYNTFIAQEGFLGSAALAGQAAAAAAVSARATDALFTLDSLRNAARVAAVTALGAEYGAAARALLTELPLAGRLGPGLGDTRLSYDIRRAQGSPLGSAALTGEIQLPANHPTNPFRHRQNPDHRVGFDVRRLLRFDFDEGSGGAVARPGFGVDRLSGVYREEVHGLHKPLGPNRDVGLRVEGRFELRRISTIDALNAR